MFLPQANLIEIVQTSIFEQQAQRRQSLSFIIGKHIYATLGVLLSQVAVGLNIVASLQVHHMVELCLLESTSHGLHQ